MEAVAEHAERLKPLFVFGKGGTGFGDTLLTPAYRTVLDVIYRRSRPNERARGPRSSVVADPFARKSHKLGYSTFEYTNDLNRDMPTAHHLDVHEFLERVIDVPLWGALIDPPFTPAQVREIYGGVGGVGPEEGEREIRRMYDHCFQVLGDAIEDGGFLFSFGYHSEGSQRPDFQRIVVVAFYAGGAHKDVYMVVERKGSLAECRAYQDDIAPHLPVWDVPVDCLEPHRVFDFRLNFSREIADRDFEIIASPQRNPIQYLQSLKPSVRHNFFVEAPMTSTHLAAWVDAAGRKEWTDPKNHPRFLAQLFGELYRLRPAVVVLKFLTANGIFRKAGFRPFRAILLPSPSYIFGDSTITLNCVIDDDVDAKHAKALEAKEIALGDDRRGDDRALEETEAAGGGGGGGGGGVEAANDD